MNGTEWTTTPGPTTPHPCSPNPCNNGTCSPNGDRKFECVSCPGNLDPKKNCTETAGDCFLRCLRNLFRDLSRYAYQEYVRNKNAAYGKKGTFPGTNLGSHMRCSQSFGIKLFFSLPLLWTRTRRALYAQLRSLSGPKWVMNEPVYRQ